MTIENALQALEILAKEKKIRKNSLAYQTAVDAVKNPGELIVCGSNSGSGNYASSKSWQKQTAHALRMAGIPFETSNVAPRGGKNGDRITVKL